VSCGKWLVRMEDIDPPREVAGSAQRIIQDLARFGLNGDEPVLFQSQRRAAHERACDELVRSGQAYWCGCSRNDLLNSGTYPGTCRNGISRGKKPRAVRIRVNSTPVEFHDRLQGTHAENLLSTSGDFVVRRADGLIAYQLAVVLDDAFQGVSEVVRGADLLDSTARQVWLQRCLNLPTPKYAHIPVAVLGDGAKLSKSNHADPVRSADPARALRAALAFLGHPAPPLNLTGTWRWALDNWSLEKVPRQLARQPNLDPAV
jgi:glutamyl-Q tRNA(Asp) synthetase